jgi:hypothetical protein
MGLGDAAHFGQKDREVERLVEDGVSPEPLGFLVKLAIAKGGNQYERRAPRVLAHSSQDLQTVASGHSHVGNDQTWRRGGRVSDEHMPEIQEKGRAVLRFNDEMAIASQGDGNHSAHLAVILREKYPQALCPT